VALRSNVKYIPHFQFGEHLHISEPDTNYTITPSYYVFKSLPDVTVRPRPRAAEFSLSNNSELVYSRQLFRILKIESRLCNLDTLHPSLMVNSSYHNLIRLNIESLTPAGVHLSNIIFVKLIESSFVALHGAAIANDMGSVLIVAPPESGKTLTVLCAIARGFSYLSEDIAVLREGEVYSVPYTTTVSHQLNVRSGLRFRVINILGLNVLYGSLIKPPNILQWMTRNFIKKRAPLKCVTFLRYGDENIIELDPDNALQRILAINRQEFKYSSDPMLLANYYFTGTPDLDNIADKEALLIAKNIQNIPCYEIMSNDPRYFINLIEKTLKR
jgi:hypothetical protein